MNIDDMLKLPAVKFSQQWLGIETPTFPLFNLDWGTSFWAVARTMELPISNAIVLAHVPRHLTKVWLVAAPSEHKRYTHTWVIHMKEPEKASQRSAVLLFHRSKLAGLAWILEPT